MSFSASDSIEQEVRSLEEWEAMYEQLQREEDESQRARGAHLSRKPPVPTLRETSRTEPHVVWQQPAKKEVRTASIENVQRGRVINSPRSLKACRQERVNPTLLVPRGLSEFSGGGITGEIAHLRHGAYEKARQERLQRVRAARNALIAAAEFRKMKTKMMKEEIDNADGLSSAEDGTSCSSASPIAMRHAVGQRPLPRRLSGVSSVSSAGASSDARTPILNMIAKEGRAPTDAEQHMLDRIEARERRRQETLQRAAELEAAREREAAEKVLRVELNTLEHQMEHNLDKWRETREHHMCAEARMEGAKQRRDELFGERQKRFMEAVAKGDKAVPFAGPLNMLLAKDFLHEYEKTHA